jgi:hypothetical protein
VIAAGGGGVGEAERGSAIALGSTVNVVPRVGVMNEHWRALARTERELSGSPTAAAACGDACREVVQPRRGDEAEPTTEMAEVQRYCGNLS